MLNDEIYQKLCAMNLWGMVEAYREQIDSPGGEALSFDELFGSMVDREWNKQQGKKLLHRLKSAGFAEDAFVEFIDYQRPRNLDRSMIQKLATCDWVEKHQNVILTGAVGVGKTFIACALASKACHLGYSAMYRRVPRLLHELNVARIDGSYRKQLSRLAKTDVLVLDDLGVVPLDDKNREDLLEIMEARYRSRPAVIASQLPVEKWPEYIGDPTLADLILNQLLSDSHRFKLSGPVH